MTLILSVPLTSRHGNWASPKDSLGQSDKRRLKTEVLPSHPTCSEMPFNALHPKRTGQEWLANHSWAEFLLSCKVLIQMSPALRSLPTGSVTPLTPSRWPVLVPWPRWKVTIYLPVLTPKLDFELSASLEFVPLAPALCLARAGTQSIGVNKCIN